MARNLNEDEVTFFRLKMEHTDKSWGPHYEGPYSTKGVTKARMSWHRDYNFFTIQQLVAQVPEDGTVHDAELVWVDLESYRSA